MHAGGRRAAPRSPLISSDLTPISQVADELLLDPEEDLGEWTLRYTDRAGVLLPVDASASIGELQRHATELRVTAGRALPR